MKARTDKKRDDKDFDTVKTFRTIKERISRDISDMTPEQIREYLEKKRCARNKYRYCILHLTLVALTETKTLA